MGRVIVDSPVWSIFLGRSAPPASEPIRAQMRELVASGDVAIIGSVRQEVLSGIRSHDQFVRLREALSVIPDEPLRTPEFERAAQFSNQCRVAGIQGSPVDFLVCAVAERLDAPIFTLDRDFERYAELLPVNLHSLPSSS